MDIQDSGKIRLKTTIEKTLNRIRHPKFTGKEIAKHVILIGVEGLFARDFEKLMTYPAFQWLKEQGGYTRDLTSVYPTLTYPAYSSLITGVYPSQHGIIHNHPFQPGTKESEQCWYSYRYEMKRKTVYDLMYERCFCTASLNWPVSGSSIITYNIPEMPVMRGENQRLKLLRSSSPSFLLSQELRYTPVEKKIQECMQDSFYLQVGVRTMAKKRPHLLMLRLNALKKLRKKYGMDCRELDLAYQMYNDLLLKLLEAAQSAKILPETVVVFVGVNGQVPVHTHVHLNNILEREDLINNRGTYVDYQAYFQSIGNGAYLYIKNNDLKIEKHVREILEELKEAEIYGVKEIYRRNQLKKLQADLGIAMAIEGKEGFQFQDDFNEEDIVKLDVVTSTSGYNPYQPEHKNLAFLSGESLQSDVDLGPIQLVDIAPTIAHILGMGPYMCDGNILTRAFK